MRNLLIALFALCALTANAQWRMKARQVEARTNNFETLQSVVDTNVPPYAPSNSVQAIFEWIDDNWAANAFDTNNSYYYTDGTTQNMDNLIVRGDLEVLGNLTATNWAGDGVDTNASYYFADGTTQNLDGLIVRGDLDVEGTIRSGSVISTNSDLNESYLGYPVLTITTNMMDVTGTGTIFTDESLDRTIDNDISTHSTTGDMAYLESQTLEIDLGQFYSGFVWLTATAYGSAGGAGGVLLGYNKEAPVYTGGQPNIGIDVELSGNTDFRQFNTTSQSTNSWVKPIHGRYVLVSAFSGASGDTVSWMVNEIKVYGVTNEYRNITGGF